jgi:hypothetical protein
MIEVELFDGTVLEFPEGTSQDVINKVAKRETQARKGTTAPAVTAPATTTPAPATAAAPSGEKVVMEVEGGGRVVQLPFDGTEAVDVVTGQQVPRYSFVSPGYSTNNQRIVQGIMQGMTVADAIKAVQGGAPAAPLREQFSREEFATAGRAAGGLVGGEGVAQIPETMPLVRPGGAEVSFPAPVRAVGEYLGDAAIAAGGAGSGAWNYAGGAIADVMASTGLMSPETAQRFARDWAALPEAFAGSPGQLTTAPRLAAPRGVRGAPAAAPAAAAEAPLMLPPPPRALPAPSAAPSAVRPTVAPPASMPPAAPPVAPVAAAAPSPAPGAAPGAGPAAAPPGGPSAAPSGPTMTPDEMAADEFNKLTRKAALGGAGSQAAREKLAAMAVGNPEARAAAERLGVEMPPDVWTDHQQLRAAVGLARSQKGSEAEADWIGSVDLAARKADEALEAIDGSPDLSLISSDILRSLQKTRNDLKKEASGLYSQVDAKIKPNTLVDPTNSVQLLNQRIGELGGSGALRGKEKELFDVITDPDTPMTYARLVTLKQDVGRALEGRGGPYTDVNTAILKRVYGALAEDQLGVAASVGGDELRQTLRLANQTTAKQKALEKRIVNSFGQDLEGSVASAIRAAISTGAKKGDISGLNRVLKVIPKDLQREAIATGIAALSRSERSTGNVGTLGEDIRTPFGFSQYVKMYQGLRQNSEVYKKVAEALGEDGQKLLRDLYDVSRYINDATTKITGTGASNQALLAELRAQGVIGAAMNSTLGRRATQAAAGAAGAAVGSPMIGAAAGALVGALTDAGKRDNVRAMGDMFASDAFKDLVAKAATGTVTEQSKRRLLADPAFRKWASAVGEQDPRLWIDGALLTLTADEGEKPKAGPQ